MPHKKLQNMPDLHGIPPYNRKRLLFPHSGKYMPNRCLVQVYPIHSIRGNVVAQPVQILGFF